MSRIAKSLSLVSVLTMGSRILGLLRDVLFFSAFGASVFGEAFILAFTIPNLFRRMLGEGTLSSAFIPVYAETRKKSSKDAFDLMNKVLGRLMVGLSLLIVFVVSLSYGAAKGDWFDSDKWSNGSMLNSITFGYVLFICASAIMVGALNTRGSFFAGALSPILLNLFMISTLAFFGVSLGWSGSDLAVVLCLSVLLAGFVQFLLPFLQLRMADGWRWKLDLGRSQELDRIKSIFWVGAMGAAVVQINVLVSRFLAYSLDEQGGVSYLFLASRLIELPLGVFAIAISTVLFPELAKAATESDRKNFMGYFFRGFRMTMAVTLPAAVGLALLADPILSVLFQWGQFGPSQVRAASEVLLISSLGLPLYAISAFMVKAFHSQKQMIHPLRAALVSLLANVGFSLWLMQDHGVYGLAWANVLAAFFQTSYLIAKTRDFGFFILWRKRPLFFLPILLSSLVMGGVLYLSNDAFIFPSGKGSDLMRLLLFIPSGILIYFLCCYLNGVPEARGLGRKITKSLPFGDDS